MYHLKNLPSLQSNSSQFVKLLFIIFFTVFITACTTTEVKEDYSSSTTFINYQHYAWLADTNALSIEKEYPFVAKRIKNAILNHLHNHEAMIVRDRPQAYVSYDYIITRTEKLEPNATVGIGWGGPHWGFRGMIPMEYETVVNEKVEWVVNIYDRQKQLIWRGSTVTPIVKFTHPKEAEDYTDSIIQQIMQQYPPKN